MLQRLQFSPWALPRCLSTARRSRVGAGTAAIMVATAGTVAMGTAATAITAIMAITTTAIIMATTITAITTITRTATAAGG